MKNQRNDDSATYHPTDCLQQLLAQIMGAILFGGSVIAGLTSFSYFYHSATFATISPVVLFSLSFLGAAIAFLTGALVLLVLISITKNVHHLFHIRATKTWRTINAHHF